MFGEVLSRPGSVKPRDPNQNKVILSFIYLYVGLEKCVRALGGGGGVVWGGWGGVGVVFEAADLKNPGNIWKKTGVPGGFEPWCDKNTRLFEIIHVY